MPYDPNAPLWRPLMRPGPGEPCHVCGQPGNEGKHFIRGPKGAKCTEPGCGDKVFEHCLTPKGVMITRCLNGYHVRTLQAE
jgi:hypothetical protein